MIKKQDLILKINKILNKLNKDKLINFYNIFINKKGGSSRNLCYHLNTTDLDKEVKEKRATLQDAKITIPPRYSLTSRKLLIEFTKDIKIITTILKKNMIEDYDNLKTKNQELKYKFVCYTYYMHDDIRNLKTYHFDLISDFMEYFLNKDKKKYTISKIGNSNKLRVKTENGITIDIIYTKDYQRINLVMYLEEISEKKRKEFFDQFDECYYSPQQLQQQFTTTNQYRPYNFGQSRPALRTRFLEDDNTLLNRVGQQQGQQQATFLNVPGTTTTTFRFGGPEKEFEDEMKKIQDYLKSFTIHTGNDKKKYSSLFEDLKKQFDILVGINKKISDKSKDKPAIDTEKLRKLYDTLYNNFIDYLYSRYLYELNLIINNDKKTKEDKIKMFEFLNSKMDLFQIDEDDIAENINYLKFNEEKENFEKFLNDKKTYDKYDDEKDWELISLIVQYYISNKNGYPIKYKFYLALFKFIKNNYKLYKLYNELKEKYNKLNDLYDVEKGYLMGENRPSRELENEYNKYNDNIIDILNKIGDLFKELFGFNEPKLDPAISDSEVQSFKDKIKQQMNILIKKTYKYKKLISIFRAIINKLGRTLFTNPQD